MNDLFLTVIGLIIITIVSICVPNDVQSYNIGLMQSPRQFVEVRDANEFDKFKYHDVSFNDASNSTTGIPSSAKLDYSKSVFSNWTDFTGQCQAGFECKVSFSTGWTDKSSIVVSTNNTKKALNIVGLELDVKPKESYHLFTHIKLNKWATDSRVDFQGLNITTNEWYLIDSCPTYTLKGPLQWQEFDCGYTIDEDTTKVRVILHAGWSIEKNKEAMTWFDKIYVTKFKQFLSDPKLTSETVLQGLDGPVSMSFIGQNDFLVIENKGTVYRVTNGVKTNTPLINLSVAGDGLLGITTYKNASSMSTNNSDTTFVYLYVVDDDTSVNGQIRNRLYRYELVDNRLLDPKLLLDLPKGFYHNGGPVLIGPDKYIYVSVGELDNSTVIPHIKNKALNYNGSDAKEADGRGGILRIDQNGETVRKNGILGDETPLNKYYAYGIRNSFGIDFDPLTGRLWETENGPAFGDEINLIDPGFNGGWSTVQGIWRHTVEGRVNDSDVVNNPTDLVNFNGKGKYSSPEFTWKYTVGPTALAFVTSDKLGDRYKNNILVGDVKNGRIYHFKLNENRTGLQLSGPLIDKVADTDTELKSAIFASDFGEVTDIKFGYDGFVYFVSHSEGKIYRVVPRD